MSINQVSKKNTYGDNKGNRYTQGQINAMITKAKKEKLEAFRDENGFLFCEECGVNEKAAGKLDCSHDISVDKAKNTGNVQLLRKANNITLRCRSCHKKHDNL